MFCVTVPRISSLCACLFRVSSRCVWVSAKLAKGFTGTACLQRLDGVGWSGETPPKRKHLLCTRRFSLRFTLDGSAFHLLRSPLRAVRGGMPRHKARSLIPRFLIFTSCCCAVALHFALLWRGLLTRLVRRIVKPSMSVSGPSARHGYNIRVLPAHSTYSLSSLWLHG